MPPYVKNQKPMDELDTVLEPDQAINQIGGSDHELLMEHVYQEDHELMYIDTFLSELFKKEND